MKLFFFEIPFYPLQAQKFEVLITAVLLYGTSLKLFFGSTLFSAHRRRKFWGPNKGPVSGSVWILKLIFSKYVFFHPGTGGKIFGACLIYVMKNVSKKNNFQTDFFKNKIKIKTQGVATPDFRLILILFPVPGNRELPPPPPPPGKKECKGLFKVFTTLKDNILDYNHYLFYSARSAEKFF